MRRAARGRGLRGNQPGAPQGGGDQPPRQQSGQPQRQPSGPPQRQPSGPPQRQQPTQPSSAPFRGEPSTSTSVGDVETKFSQMGVSSRSDQSGNGNGRGNGNGDQRSRQHAGRSRLYSLKNLQVVTKPENITIIKGTTGRELLLQANYYKLLTKPDWCLFLYHVSYSPEIDVTPIKKGLLNEHRQKLGGFLFDGSSLWTTNQLCGKNEEIGLVSTRRDGQVVKITIKAAGKVEYGNFQYIQVYNIITRKCLETLGYKLVGRSYYDPLKKIPLLNHKLELWPGYATSISQREQNILLEVETTYKVIRLETALEVIRKAERLRGDYKKNVLNALVGTTVLTQYNNKTYRVSDIDFDSNPTKTFVDNRTKQPCSFIDYYKRVYGLPISDHRQPLLISKTSARQRRSGMPPTLCLIPELCRMTGLTDEIRSDFEAMRAIAQYTRVGPNVRIDRLRDFHKQIEDTSAVKKIFDEWNMKLDNRLVEVKGRHLDIEEIQVQNGQKTFCNYERSDWTKDLRSSSMFRSASLQNWGVVACVRNPNEIRGFINTLQKVASSMKFNIEMPEVRVLESRNDSGTSFSAEIDRLYNDMNPDLIMLIVPNNRADRYNAIKLRCCVHKGVPSQVVLAKNLNSKGVMSIATKIAIQMNAKVGGAPWSVTNPMSRSGTMVVGFDVCHDPHDKSRSFGATVAAISPDLTQYYSCVTPHTSGQELSYNFAVNITKALMAYKKTNGVLPGYIFVYRDGVGEGQLADVHEAEVTDVKKRLEEIYKQNNLVLKFAFVVVTKQIGTRFFNRGQNPPAGTVVDDVVTDPVKYDFYLISQFAGQGTVSPTHYNVIEDSTGLNADKMQRWTYKLTHLYYNWSGTIRVPGPCQLAHKLAFLTSQSLHTSANQDLSELLYFL